jgi:sulfite exporter TauE/SafE
MTGLSLVPIFMVGLLGGVHCVAMCGGIVSAFSMTPNARPAFPVAVRTESSATLQATALDGALRVVAYNIGRISSYTLAGAIAGGLASGARTFSNISFLQAGGYWLANLMLIALGLYLMDAWRGLTRLEAVGQVVWRHLHPLMKHLLPLDSPLKLLALGGLWGWLPCGMVYSVLLTAMLTGSAQSGATVMLVFGLGTLPTLLTMGLFGNRLKVWAARRAVRVASGLIVLGFGVLGLMRAAYGLPAGLLDVVCLTPPAAVVPR